ncbi:MAG: hypothetical protein ACW97Z_01645 [Candidatus Hodarchaeales archaeon]|jgi:hypothetical protein
MSNLNRFFSQEIGGKPNSEETIKKKKPILFTRNKRPSSLNGLSKKELLELLEQVFPLIPGFFANLAWTRQKILPKNPKITPDDLASQLGIPLLEAYYILSNLQESYSSESPSD